MQSRKSPLRALISSPVQLAVLSLLSGFGSAYAQAAKADTEVTALPEVTVTATKRTTSLQKTPVAVTALNASTLDDAHMTTIIDIAHLVPGFQATTQGDHGVITMTLRGIGNDSAKTEYADPEVALFVNGVYTARPEGAAAMMFDMEGVEVLRGPQGTLWGRNSTVGAVNFQTARAVLNQQSGSVETGLGNFGRMGLRGAFNIPVNDEMAIRFAYAHEQHDGYVDYQNPKRYSLTEQQAAWAASGGAAADFKPIDYNLFVQGGQKYNAQNQTAARVSLTWNPNTKTHWEVSYERFQDRGTLSMSLMQEPRPGQKFWSALIDTAPYLHRDSDAIRSRLDYDLSDAMRLSYVAGYSKFSGASDFDADLGIATPTSFATGSGHQENRTTWSKYSSYSHELQLQSTGKQAVDWILGAYYGAEDNGIRFDIPIVNGTETGTIGWQGSFIQPKETVNTTAAFGQATWNLSEATHLTGGLRYTHDDRKNIGGRGIGWAYDPTVPAIPLDPGTDPKAPGSGFNPWNDCSKVDCNDGHYTGSKLTWLGRASYDLSKDAMVYGSVSTGYKSGGLQDGGDHYGPETLTSFEVGNKLKLMGGAMTLNTAAFHTNFKDYQFSGPFQRPDGTRAFRTTNAEGAKVSGLEAELAANLSADDRLNLSAAVTKSKVGKLLAFSRDYTLPTCTDPVGQTVSGQCLDATGNEMPHAPRFAGNLLYEHTAHLSTGTLSPRAAVHYETASWMSLFNLGDGDRQKAYARVDLGLRYAAAKGWWVDGYVRNVTDGKIKTSAGSSGTLFTAQYLPPRTYGINTGIDF